jgi:hypothetical protein
MPATSPTECLGFQKAGLRTRCDVNVPSVCDVLLAVLHAVGKQAFEDSNADAQGLRMLRALIRTDRRRYYGVAILAARKTQ